MSPRTASPFVANRLRKIIHLGHDHDNLLKLLTLLDGSDVNQRLISAEICRQLGDFSRAAELLTFEFPEDFNSAARQVKALNEQRIVTVREVIPGKD